MTGLIVSGSQSPLGLAESARARRVRYDPLIRECMREVLKARRRRALGHGWSGRSWRFSGAPMLPLIP